MSAFSPSVFSSLINEPSSLLPATCLDGSAVHVQQNKIRIRLKPLDLCCVICHLDLPMHTSDVFPKNWPKTVLPADP